MLIIPLRPLPSYPFTAIITHTHTHIPNTHTHTHIITSLHLVTSDQGWSEPHTPAYTCKKGRPSHKRPRLARTIYIYIYMRCLYNYFCRDIKIYTVIYVVYIWFWPTLQMTHLSLRADHEHPLPSHSPSSHASRALPSCCCC